MSANTKRPTQTRRTLIPRAHTAAIALGLVTLASLSMGCAPTQQARGSSLRLERDVVTSSKTTRTTTDAYGNSRTERVPPKALAPAPAPGVYLADGQSLPVRDRGALLAWTKDNPTASRELAAWMTKYPRSATQLVQWAHDNPTQVETFVLWSLGHRYEEVGAFFLGRPNYTQLEQMRVDDPAAVDALMQWSRRSEASAVALVKHPRGVVWVATNIYDQAPPAESATEASERAKTQSN